MFNYFDLSNTDDFQYMLDMMGKDVLVNGNPVRALVTNTDLNRNYDDKKISTLTEIKRGDLIEYDGKKWLVISEVNGKRYNKYKGIMRRCNYSISVQTGTQQTIIGYDPMGRPIYKTTPIYTNVDCIIESKTVAINAEGAINPIEGKISVFVQDNTETQKIQVNHTFNVMGYNWQVMSIDKTKVGLIEFVCEVAV